VDPENNEAYFLDSKLEEKLFDNETTEVICVGCLNRYKFLADKSCLCTGSNEDERVDSVVIDNSRRSEWNSCPGCQSLLDSHNLDFLYDLKDTIYCFEKFQKQAVDSRMDQYIQETIPDHQAKLTLAQGVADLKENLASFLEKKREECKKRKASGSEGGNCGSTAGSSSKSSGEGEDDAGLVTTDDVNTFFKEFVEKRRKLAQ